jgi:PAS domain S-box-containing protein
MPIEGRRHAPDFAPDYDKLQELILGVLYLLESEAALSERARRYLARSVEEVHRVVLNAYPELGPSADGSAQLPVRLHRVLCVDDDLSGLERRRAILEYKGSLVSTAASVTEAMKIFQSRDFDLVVTNQRLGPVTAAAMVREMKRFKPQMSILVVSPATRRPERIEKADAFISNSEPPEGLLAKVDEMISRSRDKAFGGLSHRKERSSILDKAEMLAGIVESSSDAIYSKTLDGTILTWNKAAEGMYGYLAGEIIGKSVALLQPVDRPGELQGILHRLAKGERVEHFETMRVAKDGHTFSVSLTISPILNTAGNMVGASTIARDLSHAKLAGQSLGTAAIRMAATVAHEIRNPLESSTNALFLLAKSPSLDDDARQFLAVAQDDLADIRQISAATLDLLRDDDQFSRHPVPVSELIDNVLALYMRKLRNLGITVNTRYDTDLQVDAELRQVFSNLVLNAADALEKAGGRLCIHLAASHDWENPTQRGLRVTVSDTGTGIPADERAQIFNPFYTTKANKGAGIGLWLCRDIVQKYGGRIRVRSTVKPGHSGTTFSVFLPAGASQLRIASAVAQRPPVSEPLFLDGASRNEAKDTSTGQICCAVPSFSSTNPS